MKRALLLCCLILALAAASAWPADYTAAPKWQITIKNDRGEPLSDCPVEQTWSFSFGQHYIENSTNISTGTDGQVFFPERLVSSPLGKMVVGRIEGLVSICSGYGPNSHIYVSKKGYDPASLWCDPKLPLVDGVLHSQIVLKNKNRPPAFNGAIETGDPAKLKAVLAADPYYARDMQGVALLGDVIRSPEVAGTNGIQMVDAVLQYLGRPNLAERYKTYGPGFGIEPYVDFEDKDHLTPLQRSILLNKIEIAEHLLSIGVMPNPEAGWQTPVQPSALHLAVAAGNVNLVKMLLVNKANLKAKDPGGNTPLDLAQKQDRSEIIQLLVQVR